MIYFELYRQLDIRMFQTMSAIDQTYGSCAKYVFDRDCLILLGSDHSIRLNILNKTADSDNPVRNWDIESEAMLWFAEDSMEAAITADSMEEDSMEAVITAAIMADQVILMIPVKLKQYCGFVWL